MIAALSNLLSETIVAPFSRVQGVGREVAHVPVVRLEARVRWEPPGKGKVLTERMLEGLGDYERSEQYMVYGEIEKAIESLEGFLKENEDHFEANHRLGFCYGYLGRHREAEPYFARAARLMPGHEIASGNWENCKRIIWGEYYCFQATQQLNAFEAYRRNGGRDVVINVELIGILNSLGFMDAVRIYVDRVFELSALEKR